MTAQQWLEKLFEFEYCDECGKDADEHEAILLGMGEYGANSFALCLTDEEVGNDKR